MHILRIRTGPRGRIERKDNVGKDRGGKKRTERDKVRKDRVFQDRAGKYD